MSGQVLLWSYEYCTREMNRKKMLIIIRPKITLFQVVKEMQNNEDKIVQIRSLII